MGRKRITPLLILLATLLCWAGSFPAIKIALEAYSPPAIAAMRLNVAALVLLCSTAVTGIRLPACQDMPLFIVLAGIGMTGYYLLLNYAETFSNAGTTAFVINSAPVLTAAIGHFLFGEPFTLRQWLGLILAWSGISILVNINGNAGVSWPGIMVMLAAALCWSICLSLQKLLLQKYSPNEVTVVSLTIAAPGSIALITPSNLLNELDRSGWRATSAAIFLGAGSTALAYLLWAWLLKRYPLSLLAASTYLVPVMAAVLAWTLLHEPVSVRLLTGGLITISGVILTLAYQAIPD